MERVRRTLSPLRPQAVVLYGGYGRGEGSWILDPAAPCGWRPYNDYDLLVVGGPPIPAETLRELKLTLSEAFGLRWVDLTQKQPWQLRILPPRIYTYDLKVASQVVLGSEKVLELIPEVSPATLSLREAETLFFTRLWTLTGGVTAKDLGSGVAGERSRFFRNQMAKAVLAAGDMILLRHGSYHSSYRQRVASLCEMSSLPEDQKALLQWALDEKLRPKAGDMSATEVAELHSVVRRFFLDQSFASLRALYGIEAETVAALRKAYYRDRWNLLKRLFRAGRLRSMRYERYLRVAWAQAHVVAARDQGWSAPDDLLQAEGLLRRSGSKLGAGAQWDDLRGEAASLRMALG